MKKQLFAIVLILSYRLNSMVTVTSFTIPIEKVTIVDTPQLSVTDSSGQNYTCDFQKFDSSSTFSDFKFIGNQYNGPGKIQLTVNGKKGKKSISLNNCRMKIQWLVAPE